MPARDPRKGGAARKYGDRLVLDGILFVLRPGRQWRMIPRDLLPWDAAYRWYRKWATDGVWNRIHDTLRAMVRIADGRDPGLSPGVPAARLPHPLDDRGGRAAGAKRPWLATFGPAAGTAGSQPDKTNRPPELTPPRRCSLRGFKIKGGRRGQPS